MIHSLSVVVPVFNEAQGISSSLSALGDALAACVTEGSLDRAEVLVVDDGSDDETPQILAELDDIRVFRRQHNEGYGSAVKWGVRQAAYEWILIIDGDASYPASDVDRLLAAWSPGVEMIVGARSFAEIHNPKSWNVAKRYCQRWLSTRLGSDIVDLNSGMRLFRRSHAAALESVLSDGFSYSSGITVAFLRGGLGINYVPIRYLERKGQSKVRPLSFTVAFVRSVFRAYVLTPRRLAAADLDRPVADKR